MLCRLLKPCPILQQRQRRGRPWRSLPGRWSCTSWYCLTPWRGGGSGRAHTTEAITSRARQVDILHPAYASKIFIVLLPWEHMTKHGSDVQGPICHAFLCLCLSIWQRI